MNTPTCKVLRESFETGAPIAPQHAQGCAECQAEAAAHQAVLALAEDLPYTPLSPDRVEDIRNQVLTAQAAPRAPRDRRWLWAAGFGALALTGALLQQLFSARPPPSAPLVEVLRAEVQPAQGARYVHQAAKAQRPETVRLEDGTLELSLPALAASAPLVLATDDAEVAFEAARCVVVAEAGRLQRIQVLAGMVELRRPGEGAMRLGEGASWERTSPAAPTASGPVDAAEPAPSGEAPTKVVLTPTPSGAGGKKAHPRPVPADERAFQAGWAAIRAGDYPAAIEALAQVEALDPESQFVEDARYGLGVALAKAGRGQEARVRLEQFLLQHPSSVRAEEVAVTLGWLRLEAGENDGARTAFRRAVGSSVPRIKESAQKGLSTLDPR